MNMYWIVLGHDKSNPFHVHALDHGHADDARTEIRSRLVPTIFTVHALETGHTCTNSYVLLDKHLIYIRYK